jgi:hypothetical protein
VKQKEEGGWGERGRSGLTWRAKSACVCVLSPSLLPHETHPLANHGAAQDKGDVDRVPAHEKLRKRFGDERA